MANSTVSSIITEVNYDLVIDSSDTSRNNEIIAYINRFNRHFLMPMLIDYKSSYGWTEWKTVETVANVRKVTLPSSFVSFERLYLVEGERSDTATAGASTTITLDADADTTNDAYNSYLIRTTGGTGADQQKTITDYVGSTLVATVDSAWSTNPSSDTTFIIFKEPSADNELTLRSQDYLLKNYNTTGKPEAYAITTPSADTSYMILGNIPDDIYILQGYYYSLPTALTLTTNNLPYQPVFDELLRQYVTFMAMNRDEYDLKVESSLLSMLQDKVVDIIMGQQERSGKSVEYKGVRDS